MTCPGFHILTNPDISRSSVAARMCSGCNGPLVPIRPVEVRTVVTCTSRVPNLWLARAGCALLVGGLAHHSQRFDAGAARMMCSLLVCRRLFVVIQTLICYPAPTPWPNDIGKDPGTRQQMRIP